MTKYCIQKLVLFLCLSSSGHAKHHLRWMKGETRSWCQSPLSDSFLEFLLPYKPAGQSWVHEYLPPFFFFLIHILFSRWSFSKFQLNIELYLLSHTAGIIMSHKFNAYRSFSLSKNIIEMRRFLRCSMKNIKRSQEEAQFHLLFYSKFFSISLVKHRKNCFFSKNIQFSAFCRKSCRAVLTEGDSLVTCWHTTLHPISSDHKRAEWLYSTLSEFFQDSSAVPEWKAG